MGIIVENRTWKPKKEKIFGGVSLSKPTVLHSVEIETIEGGQVSLSLSL